jgi:hypothetical protein
MPEEVRQRSVSSIELAQIAMARQWMREGSP